MKKMVRILMAMCLLVTAAIVSPLPIPAKAQTNNQTTKFQVTETFTFPNECTNELLDVTTTSVVTCHDQQRADGTFDEKCQIRQEVNAVGQTTGITLHGSGTFKDEFTSTDSCNFSFSNRGRVRLISPGSTMNTVLTFDDILRMENCVLTADTHFVSADCRGRNQ